MIESQPCAHEEHLSVGEIAPATPDSRSPSPGISNASPGVAPAAVPSCTTPSGALSGTFTHTSLDAGAAVGNGPTADRPSTNARAAVTNPRPDTFKRCFANAPTTPVGASIGPAAAVEPRTAQGLQSIPERVRTRLEKKLLSLGGTRVLWHPDPDVAQVLARGRLFTEPVCLTPHGSEHCHANAAERWARDTENSRLVTGYGLSGGEWVSHSWVLADGKLHETTGLMDRYFGITLNPWVSVRFFVENALARRYPGFRGVPKNWMDRYPGLFRLLQQVVSMSERQLKKFLAQN